MVATWHIGSTFVGTDEANMIDTRTWCMLPSKQVARHSHMKGHKAVKVTCAIVRHKEAEQVDYSTGMVVHL